MVEPGTTRSDLYVAMTRGRESNHAWLLEAPDAASVAESFESTLGKGVDRGSALAVGQQLHRAAGLTIEPLQIGRTMEPGHGIEL